MSRLVLKYVLFFVLNIILLNIVLYFVLFNDAKPKPISPYPIGTLEQKLAYYKIHKKEFKLLFIGDSRTYTNINNYQIDTLINTSSFNMSMWANWFPTQYSFLQDFLPEIPDSTTLVFSLGYQNFNFGDIQETYPIEYERAKEYIDWGFTWQDMRRPLVYKNSKILPVLFLSQSHVHEWLMEEMTNYIAVFPCKNKTSEAAPVAATEAKEQVAATDNMEPAKSTAVNSQKPEVARISPATLAQKLETEFNANPHVDYAQRRMTGGTLTSVEVFWNRGNYWRIEIDTLFFRAKQNANGSGTNTKVDESRSPEYIPDDRYWKNFVAITQLLKKHNKRLHIIFNKVDEAPYTYGNGRSGPDKFLLGKLKNYVLSQGFEFITVDVADIPDSYYFDYDHMNHKGSQEYSKRLSGVLKERMKNAL